MEVTLSARYPTDPRAASVLVVDEDRAVALLVSRGLESMGATVRLAYDGLSALEVGMTERFDVVVMELMLPGLLGAEVLQRWVRAGFSAPVIVVSAAAHDDEIVRILDMGAADFVRKPFNVRELLARVRVQLRGSETGTRGRERRS